MASASENGCGETWVKWGAHFFSRGSSAAQAYFVSPWGMRASIVSRFSRFFVAKPEISIFLFLFGSVLETTYFTVNTSLKKKFKCDAG